MSAPSILSRSVMVAAGPGRCRADAVRQYLLGHGGLPDERIRAVSYGEDATRLILPEGAGPGEFGIQNRRAVLVVDYVARQSVGSSSAPSQGAESGF